MSETSRTLVLLVALLLFRPVLAQDLVGKMGEAELRIPDLKMIIDAQPPEVRRQLATELPQLERLVRNELLRKAVLAEARQKGWDKRAELQPLIERARDQVVVSAYLGSLTRPAEAYPSEEELKQFYEANKTQLKAPAQYQLAQIFLAVSDDADKARANDAAKRITELASRLAKPGTDFARQARENSEHKDSAAKGGDLGWLAEGQLVPEIRSALVKMVKGEVSAPIRTAAGWHLVKLLDRKPAAVRPLEEVRANLIAAVRQRKAQELERAYLETLASKSKPTINQIELNKLQSGIR
jgi:peptidylprolyl isomerase